MLAILRNQSPCKGRRFKGVYTRGNKWRARIMVSGKTKYLGTFNTPEEAAQAYNDAIDLYCNGARWRNPVNLEEVIRLDSSSTMRNRPPRKGHKFKGVYAVGNKWQAKIKVSGKQKYLGTFNTPEEAAQAYNNAIDLYWDGDGWKNPV
jgi:hypothetical protein